MDSPSLHASRAPSVNCSIVDDLHDLRRTMCRTLCTLLCSGGEFIGINAFVRGRRRDLRELASYAYSAGNFDGTVVDLTARYERWCGGVRTRVCRRTISCRVWNRPCVAKIRTKTDYNRILISVRNTSRIVVFLLTSDTTLCRQNNN